MALTAKKVKGNKLHVVSLSSSQSEWNDQGAQKAPVAQRVKVSSRLQRSAKLIGLRALCSELLVLPPTRPGLLRSCLLPKSE